ncbi:MAG: TerB N-terminal domain-containing protein [Clostridia bacterium]|nr:TerB N-terminal domain-containing protein [Clostridia bacterium]
MKNDDRFWSVDKLLPRRGQASPARAGAFSLRELEVDADRQEVLFERDFPDSAVLCRAVVTKRSAHGGSYSGFADSARALANRLPSDLSASSKYFSYAPCFTELTPAQIDTYLCFRSDARRKIRRRTDYSYFLLYVYELINLCSETNAKDTLEDLIWLWKNYREDFAVIDRIFCDWVFDLCTEFSLPLPFASLDLILPSVPFRQNPAIYGCYIFDHILREGGSPDAAQTDFLLNCLCDYHFRRVGYYLAHPDYAEAIDGFVAELFARGLLTSPERRRAFLSLPVPTPMKIRRPLYSGAVVDPLRKKGVEIEYCPLTGDMNVKDRFTSLIKYADNKTRRLFGTKAKFSSVNISPLHSDFIDEVFDSFFSKKKASLSPEISESPVRRSLEVDLERARGIEESSWESTRILTAGSDDEGETVLIGASGEPAPSEAAPGYDGDTTEFAASLDENEQGFLIRLLYADPAEARRYAAGCGQFFESFVGKLNRKAREFTGDVVLRPDGRVLQDYREDLEFLFPRDQYGS